MPLNRKWMMIAAATVLSLHTAGAQTPDRAKVLKAAADAMGMPRWSQVGGERLPAVDVVNTVEFWATGTSADMGKGAAASQPVKTEYHAALRYNIPAMRVEMTRTGSGAPQHTIQVVSDKYAWNESEIGGGLIPGKGTATPVMNAANDRLLQLWLLPYGVVKAALAAEDKTKVSVENGATVLTFPLSAPLSGTTVKATLNDKNQVTKVETKSDNPAEAITVEYSDYADRAEIPTDVLFPHRIVEKQGGRPVLDLEVKKVDNNNPYLVFPVPPNVKSGTAQAAAGAK
jgi:hypothetical protein